MKQFEMDQAQHREANETALAAIGIRKKRKVEEKEVGTKNKNPKLCMSPLSIQMGLSEIIAKELSSIRILYRCIQC